MDHSRVLLASGCAVALLAALALYPWRQTPPATPVPPPTAPAPAAVGEPIRATVPPKPPAPQPGPHLLRLPDGSEVAPLNGVAAPAPFVWGEGPYSPIVGQEFGNGVDWYVHADGTRSTTLERWRNDLQRVDAVTLVMHPKAALPVETGEPRK